MKLNRFFTAGSVVALSALAANAYAKVPADQAARLGKDLTPIGAEMAGNGKEIPAWEGGLTTPPANYKGDGNYVDPFPQDKPKFVITNANVAQYKEHLSQGQIAMLAKYPDTFKIPVFETRRTAALPQFVYDGAKKNATSVDLIAGGNGVTPFTAAVPFPILSGDSQTQALQVIFNHITRYRGGSLQRTIGQVTPLSNGQYSLVKFLEEIVWRTDLTDYDPNKNQNVLFYFKQEIVSPARLAGNVLLVHETLDQVKEPRLAWIYNAGQRRVRRAPQVAYDGPGTASDGMRTSDNFDMYNGAPDRYNWKLIGKKELYIPYNSYRLADKKLKYDDIVKAGHINQDYTRYELHRVWQVEATLKPDQRHIYAKRVFYVDEDSWQAAVIDHFDGRGELWRLAEAHEMSFYDEKLPWYSIEVLYDLLSGRYLALGLSNEEPNAYKFGTKRAEQDFTPSALRQSGVR